MSNSQTTIPLQAAEPQATTTGEVQAGAGGGRTGGANPPSGAKSVTTPVQDGTWFWLWRNGDYQFLAFDNPYPCKSVGGDPLTLGEPCGISYFRKSENGRADRSHDYALSQMKKCPPLVLQSNATELRAKVVSAIMGLIKKEELRPRPTIDELEKLLREDHDVRLEPDGSAIIQLPCNITVGKLADKIMEVINEA